MAPALVQSFTSRKSPLGCRFGRSSTVTSPVALSADGVSHRGRKVRFRRAGIAGRRPSGHRHRRQFISRQFDHDHDESVLAHACAGDSIPEGRTEEAEDPLGVPRRGSGGIPASGGRPRNGASERLDRRLDVLRWPPSDSRSVPLRRLKAPRGRPPRSRRPRRPPCSAAGPFGFAGQPASESTGSWRGRRRVAASVPPLAPAGPGPSSPRATASGAEPGEPRVRGFSPPARSRPPHPSGCPARRRPRGHADHCFPAPQRRGPVHRLAAPTPAPDAR